MDNASSVMLTEHKESVSSSFEGTIVDIETIGEFNKLYQRYDSRYYKDIKQVVTLLIDPVQPQTC